jgi:hypothetical protein
MTSISRRRRLLALLLVPFMMVLAGCGKLHADFEIQDAETINVSFDFAIDEEFASASFDSADEMCTSLESEMDVVDESAPSVEPYEADGAFGCRIVGVLTSEDFDSGFSLTEEDGEYHLTISGDDTSVDDIGTPEMAELDFDFRMTFTFPGEIIESSGGQIDGNSVTYTDVAEFGAGVDIRAEANTFPWVIVIIAVLVIGFLLLLVLAAIVFFVVRSRRNRGGGSGTPGGYGAAAGPTPMGATYAGPQGGQQWGQTSPPAGPQGGQQWGQTSPPAAPQGGQQWGQTSPPAAPQGGQQWGQTSPPAAPQGGQQWGAPQQDGQGPQQPPWAHPDAPQNPGQNPGQQGPPQSGW